jgi:uncharacterized membrane protein YfcA
MDLGIVVVVLVVVIAHLLDGALGMAYGLSSYSFLLSIGIPPAAASASVHMAECVTTAVSGASHWKLGTIDKVLIRRLLIPGVLGGVAGAYLLTSIEGKAIKPYISAYLLIMGIVILVKAVRKNHVHKQVSTHLIPLGLVGGFFDAIGGGGWGPIVTTTLVARGNAPRYAIGSVNFSEFFVTVAQSVTFLLTLGMLTTWKIIVGLLVGGIIAAPLAAVAAKKVPTRILMTMVGILIIILSLRTILLL